MKHIILIELYSYHTECLYSQILFLKSAGYQVTLVCDKSVEKIVRDFPLEIKIVFYDFSNFISFFSLRSFILRCNFNRVVLNTAQGNRALKFLLQWFPRRIHFFGVLHDTSKLKTSFGQKIISRKVRSYFVLSKYVYLSAPRLKNISIQYFNPSFFPSYVSQEKEVPFKGDTLWIVVPGSLEYKRRDYDFLINFSKNTPLNKLKFILLGNSNKGDGNEIVDELKKYELDKHFTFFNEFVPNYLFEYYLKNADFLLPLINPGIKNFESYMKCKISGMFPLSFSYQVPLLCHNMFQSVDGFDYPALFYDSDQALCEIIVEGKPNDIVNKVIFEEEKDRYISFIEEHRRV